MEPHTRDVGRSHLISSAHRLLRGAEVLHRRRSPPAASKVRSKWPGYDLKNLDKDYANGFKAVHGIDLDIRDGEFMVLVGPSGCAKSTTLRMVAGLEDDHRRRGSDRRYACQRSRPRQRGIAMVFQNYALYPHMKVLDNLAFGLQACSAHPKAGDRDAACARSPSMLEIERLLDRLPKQLSGGQAQRVAVGRALIKKPDVFLFDEPCRISTPSCAPRCGCASPNCTARSARAGQPATVVYVTHDQVEAMTMGDRICVMKDGRIMQVADPRRSTTAPPTPSSPALSARRR